MSHLAKVEAEFTGCRYGPLASGCVAASRRSGVMPLPSCSAFAYS